jgi:hypothetical protein
VARPIKGEANVLETQAWNAAEQLAPQKATERGSSWGSRLNFAWNFARFLFELTLERTTLCPSF